MLKINTLPLALICILQVFLSQSAAAASVDRRDFKHPWGLEYVCDKRPDEAKPIYKNLTANIFIDGWWDAPQRNVCVSAWFPLDDGSHVAVYKFATDKFTDTHFDDFKDVGFDMHFSYTFPWPEARDTKFQIAVWGQYGKPNPDPEDHYGWYTEEEWIVVEYVNSTPPTVTTTAISSATATPAASASTGPGVGITPSNQGNQPGSADAGGQPYTGGTGYGRRRFPPGWMGINGNPNYHVQEYGEGWQTS